MTIVSTWKERKILKISLRNSRETVKKKRKPVREGKRTDYHRYLGHIIEGSMISNQVRENVDIGVRMKPTKNIVFARDRAAT